MGMSRSEKLKRGKLAHKKVRRKTPRTFSVVLQYFLLDYRLEIISSTILSWST